MKTREEMKDLTLDGLKITVDRPKCPNCGGDVEFLEDDTDKLSRVVYCFPCAETFVAHSRKAIIWTTS